MDTAKRESFALDRENIGVLGAIAIEAYTSAKLQGATEAEAKAVVPSAMLNFLDAFCRDGRLPVGITPDAFKDILSVLPTEDKEVEEDEEDEDMIPI